MNSFMKKFAVSDETKQVIIKWLEALRSGEYVQGKGALKAHDNKDRYCCMGVLCDVAFPDEWSEPISTPDEMIFSFRNSTGYPPLDILDGILG